MPNCSLDLRSTTATGDRRYNDKRKPATHDFLPAGNRELIL